MRKLVWIKSHYVSSINNTFCVERKEGSPEGLSLSLNCPNSLTSFDSFSVGVFSQWGRPGKLWVLSPADDDHSSPSPPLPPPVYHSFPLFPSPSPSSPPPPRSVGIHRGWKYEDCTELYSLFVLCLSHTVSIRGLDPAHLFFFLLTNSFLSYSLVRQVGFKKVLIVRMAIHYPSGLWNSKSEFAMNLHRVKKKNYTTKGFFGGVQLSGVQLAMVLPGDPGIALWAFLVLAHSVCRNGGHGGLCLNTKYPQGQG